MKSFITLFALAALASAQPAIAPPQVGFLYDGATSYRPVFGIAGNFIVGSPAFASVANASYSGSFGLVKTDTAIIATNNQGQQVATKDAPVGAALFAFQSDGSPAFAYLPTEQLLLKWTGAGFQTVSLNSVLFPAGAVQAIFAPDASHVGMLVQRVDGLMDIRVRVATGDVDSQTVISGVRTPALILSSGELIHTDRNGIVVRRADGTEVNILGQMPARFSLAQMGAGWIALTDSSSGAQYAVRVTTGREGFYCLPAIQTEATK